MEKKVFPQAKLTKEQKDAIFADYVKIKKPGERWGWETRMAEQYGVHRSTIHKITHDEKRMQAWLAKGNHAFDLATGQMKHLAADALSVQAGYIYDENIPVEQQYLRQNASVDVMNRAGLKAKPEENENKVTVTLEAGMGFKLGAPEGGAGEN